MYLLNTYLCQAVHPDGHTTEAVQNGRGHGIWNEINIYSHPVLPLVSCMFLGKPRRILFSNLELASENLNALKEVS